MDLGGLRVEERSKGAKNWSPWKARIMLILEEQELWDIVEQTVVLPTDPIALADFKKANVEAKRIILDAVKDHVIPHVSGKANAFQMWESLRKLYQSSNQNRKMVLQEKLRSTKMTKAKSVTSYLTRISQVLDQLAAVGEIVVASELLLEKACPTGKGYGMTSHRRS